LGRYDPPLTTTPALPLHIGRWQATNSSPRDIGPVLMFGEFGLVALG
jgi:hypothetical protein